MSQHPLALNRVVLSGFNLLLATGFQKEKCLGGLGFDGFSGTQDGCPVSPVPSGVALAVPVILVPLGEARPKPQ